MSKSQGSIVQAEEVKYFIRIKSSDGFIEERDLMSSRRESLMSVKWRLIVQKLLKGFSTQSMKGEKSSKGQLMFEVGPTDIGIWLG